MPSCEERKNMGFDFGLSGLQACFPKRKNRWLFKIYGVCGEINTLPPLKTARPQLDFQEQQVSHLVQKIYYPIMADWKPVQLTLYDTTASINKVFDWVKLLYDPNGDNEWKYIVQSGLEGGFKRKATLCLFDGCGKVVEKWVYENVYPQAVNFGDLDMGDTHIVTIDLTLRYDRAWVE